MSTTTVTIPSAVSWKLKNRANYSKWRFSTRYHLEDRDLYDACTKKKSEATIDHLARSTIISSVSSMVIKELLNCEMAKSMWDRLQNLYEDNNLNCFIILNQEIFATKFENCKNMGEYIEKMHSIGIKMRTILPAYPDQAVAVNIF